MMESFANQLDKKKTVHENSMKILMCRKEHPLILLTIQGRFLDHSSKILKNIHKYTEKINNEILLFHLNELNRMWGARLAFWDICNPTLISLLIIQLVSVVKDVVNANHIDHMKTVSFHT